MSINREKAMDRVRKLLNHTKGDGHFSEAEIETYMRHARKLMDEFNIAEAEIAVEGSDASQAAYESIKKENAYRRAHLDRFMVELGWAPAIITDTKFYVNRNYDSAEHITYYGLPCDVAIACELYKELLVAMRTMCRVRYGTARPIEYKDYCLGFAIRLRERANAIKQQSSEQSNTTAIVLAKDSLLDRWAKEMLSLTKRKARSANVRDDAYTAGANDGERVSLDTNQIRNEPRAPTKQLR